MQTKVVRKAKACRSVVSGAARRTPPKIPRDRGLRGTGTRQGRNLRQQRERFLPAPLVEMTGAKDAAESIVFLIRRLQKPDFVSIRAARFFYVPDSLAHRPTRTGRRKEQAGKTATKLTGFGMRSVMAPLEARSIILR